MKRVALAPLRSNALAKITPDHNNIQIDKQKSILIVENINAGTHMMLFLAPGGVYELRAGKVAASKASQLLL